DISEERAKQYITQWCGEDCVPVIDLKKKREDPSKLRGFGFVEFEHEDFVDKLVIKQGLMMGDKRVEVKKAEPRENMGEGGGGRGGRSGRGGGSDGYRGGRSSGGGYGSGGGG
ncbi:hypothetical protein, partial [Salmonella sp. s54395]|uniref:hypothetical protein n=1 Tax=Salmonella sp. s54395 TaxID=3159664 RepID=UPI00397F8137